MLAEPVDPCAAAAGQVEDQRGAGVVHQADDALRLAAVQAPLQGQDEVQAEVAVQGIGVACHRAVADAFEEGGAGVTLDQYQGRQRLGPATQDGLAE